MLSALTLTAWTLTGTQRIPHPPFVNHNAVLSLMQVYCVQSQTVSSVASARRRVCFPHARIEATLTDVAHVMCWPLGEAPRTIFSRLDQYFEYRFAELGEYGFSKALE